jgi:hypothetical protein
MIAGCSDDPQKASNACKQTVNSAGLSFAGFADVCSMQPYSLLLPVPTRGLY